MDGVNYYQLFSLTPGGDLSDLKSRYRRLSLEHHPDRGGSTEQMARLNEAYQTLSNPLLRREYDRKLEAPSAPTATSYQYTQPTRSTRTYAYAPPHREPVQETRERGNFWRWFIVLVLMGLALIIYDVLSLVVMPAYVKQTAAAASSDTTASDTSSDLSGFANSALSEMQDSSMAPTVTPQTQASPITTVTPDSDTTTDNSSDSASQSTTGQQTTQPSLRDLRRMWRNGR